MVKEVSDDVPVLQHLVGSEALIHEVVADVLHPRHEVEAGIASRRLLCVKVMVTAEPWKLVVSATASGPNASIRKTVLLTASQLRREPAPKVSLNVVNPALLVVAREHHVTTCQIAELAG